MMVSLAVEWRIEGNNSYVLIKGNKLGLLYIMTLTGYCKVVCTYENKQIYIYEQN